MTGHFIPLDDYDQEELDLSGDVWKVCPNYPEYEASYNGWARSWVTISGVRRHNPLYHEGLRLVVRMPDGSLVNRRRAHLVADAFLVPREPLWQLLYLDGNNSNTAARNLAWEERQARLIRAEEQGLIPHDRKTACKWGHSLVEGSFKLTALGARDCLICARARSSCYRRKLSLTAKGLPSDHLTLEYVLKERGEWVEPEDRVS